MTNIGPFSIQAVLIAGAAFLSWLVARLWARRIQVPAALTGALMLDGLLVGFAVARLTYVIHWWNEYLATPWAIIAIGDGGFLPLPGIVAGMAWIVWRARKHHLPLKPLLGAALLGILCWQTGNLLVQSGQKQHRLPDFDLLALDGKQIQSGQLEGKPVVINLWASWCPPCRREMPVFAKAQAQFAGTHILLINQGEDPHTIAQHLQQQGLNLDNILLDPASSIMHSLSIGALPSTLFFDAQGQLQRAHTGEMTFAAFKDALQKTTR